MSHCCIENCVGELAQVINKFTNHQENVQANPYEKANIKSLYELCKEYIKEYEEYESNEEEYIKYHSAPEDDDY